MSSFRAASPDDGAGGGAVGDRLRALEAVVSEVGSLNGPGKCSLESVVCEGEVGG